MIRGKIYEIARIVPPTKTKKLQQLGVEFLYPPSFIPPPTSEFYFTVIDLFRLNFKRLSITILEIIRIDVA